MGRRHRRTKRKRCALRGGDARSVVRPRRPKQDLETRKESKCGCTRRRVRVDVLTAGTKGTQEGAGEHKASAQYHDRGRGVDG